MFRSACQALPATGAFAAAHRAAPVQAERTAQLEEAARLKGTQTALEAQLQGATQVR